MSNSATETSSVILERTFAHPPLKVWRAITQSDLIAKWLMDNDFEPSEDHRFQFRTDPNPYWSGIVDGEVRAVEPEQRLVYTWLSDGVDTVVELTLREAQGGTLLRVEHSGFRKNQCGPLRGAESGWRRFFGQLSQVVDSME